MTNVLETIVENRRIEIDQLKRTLPLESFIDQLKPSKKSLVQALSCPNTSYILECKKASPSKGLLRSKFDIDEIIDAYTPHAAAFSVLTDSRYFQGEFSHLKHITSKVQQPVLNKDFFFDPYQVYLGRYYNADAILLMLSVLDDATYMHLSGIAKSLSIDVITEVSNQKEVDRALHLNAPIIGINNRNLRDLSTHLQTTENLAPRIPKDRIIIAESGINTNKDVRRLAPLVHGFLVGSSLMSQPDLPRAVSKLVYGSVKICGLTQIKDAHAVKNSGATYGGLIFAPTSPRYIQLAQAKSLVREVPFNYVGVFVDADLDTVVTHAQSLNLVAVQLHGQEDQHYIQALRSRLPKDCAIWLTKPVTDSLPAMTEQLVDVFLLDTKVGSQQGGTGQSFDWEILKTRPQGIPIALAGGIGPHNIQKARQTGADILDINSQIEHTPAIKDHQKLKALMANLRTY